jgi:cysteine desulfurase family protein (TIGR01976 family)
VTSASKISGIDLAALRAQFPALSLARDGAPVVFLDNPAGTQVSRRVIDRVRDYWSTMNANHGGLFLTSQRSDAMVERARQAAAAFLNASPAEVVFGANMTTLSFAVSRAIGRELRPDDEIVVTRLEHDGNVAPWLALEPAGVRVRFADVRPGDCTLDLQDLERQVNPRTRLVAVTHASNAVGSIPEVKAVGAIAHAVGALLWVDAVHYAPHGPIDVRDLDCDFLVCSGYKFYGPHVGVLYGRAERLERLTPFKVRPAPDQGPGRWETGTPNFEGIAGLLGAFEYLAWLGGGEAPDRPAFLRAMDWIRSHERDLALRLVAGLSEIPGLRIHGITDPTRFAQRVPTVSLTWEPHRPEDLARWLGDHGVFTWHGDHYAKLLIERLGLADRGGTLRLGIAHYNTASEIDQALELLAGYPAINARLA